MEELYVKLSDVQEALKGKRGIKEILDSLEKYDLNGNEKNEKSEELSEIKEVIEYLNQSIGAHYKLTTQKTKSFIRARLREGFTVDDFKTVIDKKSRAWLNDERMQKYLRPETLFGTKFEGYLNEQETYKLSGNRADQKKESTYERIQRLAREGAFGSND
jgi:uncharacterized phage protein (TIGR02220 family)